MNKRILHVFTKSEKRDEYFNKVKSGNLVTRVDNRTKIIFANGITHHFVVIIGAKSIDKLRGITFSDVEYHDRPKKLELIMQIESRVWKDPNTIHIPIPTELYFNIKEND